MQQAGRQAVRSTPPTHHAACSPQIEHIEGALSVPMFRETAGNTGWDKVKKVGGLLASDQTSSLGHPAAVPLHAAPPAHSPGSSPCSL